MAQDLSQFAQSPGSGHVAAASTPEYAKCMGGLTFRESGSAFNQSYPHRHTLIGMRDSGFSHCGVKAVSAVWALMNGAVIYHASRRQSAVSQAFTEAEVEVAALVAEVPAAIVQLWSNIRRGGTSHGAGSHWQHCCEAPELEWD